MFVETKTVAALVPELILILVASGVFVGAAFKRSRSTWLVVSLVGLAAAAIALVAGYSPMASDAALVTGPLKIDELSQAFRGLGLLTGLITLLVLARLAEERLAGEIYGSILLATTGIMIASSANELVTLFLGLELISIPTYILLFLGRKNSGEATMKYFFLSILSSGLMLYGFSFLYGIGGTTIIDGTAAFPGIRQAIEGMAAPTADTKLLDFMPFAVVFILAGFAFKLTAVPFHFYAPDVYQGTTNANAGLLAVAPKIAGVVGLVRILLIALPAAAAPVVSETAAVSMTTSVTLQSTWQLLLVLSIVTMTIGNICALWQNNLRRMMAYSSVAHAGYLLIGLSAAAVGDVNVPGGVAAMVFYLIVYALASLGAFAVLAAWGKPEQEVSTFDDISGAASSQPILAAVLAICMFSLAGLPPLAGFWGKLSLFLGAVSLSLGTASPAVSLWFTILAIAGVLNAAVAAAYYLRVISVMYFQPPQSTVPAQNGLGPKLAAIICGIAVLATAYPRPLLQLGQRAENQLPRVVQQLPATSADPVAAIGWDK